MNLTADARTQIADAYRCMASEARYRPAAPGDGFGNITAPLATLDLDAEAQDYAASWWLQEDAQAYLIGCPDHLDRTAFIYTIEAARLLAGAQRATAARLLRMAADELGGAA